jgi:hypothetical protein
MINEDIKDRFRKINLFSKCGSAVELSFPVKNVFDWERAAEYFLSDEWEYVTHEAGNDLRGYLHSNKLEQFRLWNEYAIASRDFVNDELLLKIENWKKKHDLDTIFIDCVKSDLAFALIYQQYLSELKGGLPDFYESILSVYDAGYFPCGWDGNYPDGILIII